VTSVCKFARYRSFDLLIKRVRTYQVQDQTGAPLAGSVAVREYNHVAYGELDPKASNSTWTSVTFDDTLARCYGEDILQYQQFTITYSLRGVTTTAAIPVRERNVNVRATPLESRPECC
jgi:hypothetical protein